MEHKEFKVGCHLKADRLLYEHHGIYIGKSLVTHYASDDITMDTVEKFMRGETMGEVPHLDSPYTGEETGKGAFSCLGEGRYDLVSDNCEHLVNWYRTGEAESEQVEETVRLARTLLLKMLEGC